MRKTRLPLITLFGFTSVIYASATMAEFSFGQSDDALTGLGRTYGYLIGQEYKLKRIAKLYPSLQIPAKAAELEFSAKYGSSIKTKLTEEMMSKVGSENFRKMATQMESSIQKQLDSTKIPQQEAINFIEEVNSRAQGQIDKKILPYILAAEYKEQPAREFSARMRQRFDTQGHSKSQGLNLVLEVPVSWVAAEGERPHIVQKWKSMAGHGQQLITLDIRDTKVKISKQDIQDLVTSGEIKTLVPPGGTYIGGGVQTVESSPGYWVDYSITTERAGMQLNVIGRINAFFNTDRAFMISCMTTNSQQKDAEQDFAKITTLCPMVVNSVVLKDIY